jgi:steroid 5-alpha reductase family enzyme
MNFPTFDLAFFSVTVACVIFAYITFWFIMSLMLRRNDVADLAWGLGIALVAMTMLVVVTVPSLRMEMLSAMVFVWGVRLSTHIFLRFSSKTEDSRYAAWREAWGQWFVPRSYAQVFLLQGALMVVVGYPFIHAGLYPEAAFTLFDVAGVVLWTIGILIETWSDRDLRRFTTDPANAGKVLERGLWRYSRHPNYFGEVVQWWGVGIVLLAVPYGYLALISPIVLTILILYVSGIPMLESHLMKNPGYRDYARRTSKFFPLPPKKALVDSGQ